MIIDEHCQIRHEEFSREAIYELFENAQLEQIDRFDDDISSGVTLGSIHYTFEYIADEKMPLFSHEAKGRDVKIILKK